MRGAIDGDNPVIGVSMKDQAQMALSAKCICGHVLAFHEFSPVESFCVAGKCNCSLFRLAEAAQKEQKSV